MPTGDRRLITRHQQKNAMLAAAYDHFDGVVFDSRTDPFLATWENVCPRCGTIIYKGDKIRRGIWAGTSQHVHDACPYHWAALAEVLNTQTNHLVIATVHRDLKRGRCEICGPKSDSWHGYTIRRPEPALHGYPGIGYVCVDCMEKFS